MIRHAIAIERYPDQSAIAYCGPFTVVLAFDEPGEESATLPGLPWSVSLFNDDDEQIVVCVAPEPAEADRFFTGFAEHLAGYDGSAAWEEHIGTFFCA